MAILLASALALVFILMVESSPAAGASRTACHIRNTDSGQIHETLQSAIDDATNGDRLTVRGVCHGGAVIDKDLVIEGVTTPTSGKATLDGDGKTRVLLIAKGVRLTLLGLLVRDGRARAGHFDSWHRRRCEDGDLGCGVSGGGINNRGTLTLRHVVVRGNIAGGGGGISNRGTLTVRDSAVRGNTAFGGGGIYNDGGTVTLNGSSISGNETTRGTESGGLYNDRGTVTFNGSSISGNTSGGYGGGVSNDGGTVTLNGSTISRNRARYWGGGAFNGGTLTLNDTSISDNTARLGGGGVSNGGTLTLNDTSIIDNTARHEGGGVRNVGTVTLYGSTLISGNAAGSPGGGVSNVNTGIFNGVVCGPGGNVYDNQPDDCYFE